MTLRISEVFYSLQGEGIYQGVPTVFIRFQGCNLLTGSNGKGGCLWCDTKYARDGSRGQEAEIDEIAEKVHGLLPYYKSWVCITGGEPLFQLDDCHELIKKLKNYGYRVSIETNGSIKKPYWWTLVDSWCVDIKCPSSGVCGVSLIDDWFSMRVEDQIKFVVGSKEDFDFARKIINSKVAYNPVVLVSPVIRNLLDFIEGQEIVPTYYRWKSEQEWLQEVAEFCLEMKVRYSLQIQKVNWGNRRGV